MFHRLAAYPLKLVGRRASCCYGRDAESDVPPRHDQFVPAHGGDVAALADGVASAEVFEPTCPETPLLGE